ncbi:glycosyltransferase [Halpernia frigidisoli]|uniref:Glycosyl transferase family 2 n=1 Tax=Halpernia frigidisoli TaxID=1125876 RepID=A0A1I3D1T5_9FLAO|nr:glycosyltransferase [Halpernia frigidisoli]SFH80489.1 Glycosyl transferase family 2 [Halpernia frigidisoli]
MNFSKISHDQLFSRFSTKISVKICIVIPVKDEEEHIEKSLQAFAQQTDEFGDPINFDQFEILILANNCSDNSFRLIENFRRKNPFLNIYCQEIKLDSEKANIGYVRKLLMNTAFKRLSKNGGGIIMTTDSDSIVANDWINQNKTEIEHGADAVGGRISLYQNEIDEMDEFTRSLHFTDERYQLLIAEAEEKIVENPQHPNQTHHQHFNGSFAVTTECFEKSGGIPDVKFLEDCAFFERLKNIDAKIVHSHNVKVQTSARFNGRTQIGLSYQLNEWNNLEKNNPEIFVESAASIISRFKEKKHLNDLWLKRNALSDSESNVLSKVICYNEELLKSFKNSKFFGFWYGDFFSFKQLNSLQNHQPEIIGNAIKNLEKELSKL